MIILSPTNDKIKHIKKLSRRQGREKSGEFIIEGKRSVLDAIKNGAKISYIITTSEDLNIDGIKTFGVDKKTFAEITDTESPQDMLAVAKMEPATLSSILEKKPSLLVCCDRVQDPGNLGTIVRTADAVADSAVLISKGSVDLYNPKTVRSTMSSIFNVDTALDLDLEKEIDTLRANGYKIICGALSPLSEDVYSTDLSGKCAIFIGNEGSGISDEILAKADNLVIIPMNGKAESLNASVSGAILMYEHLRQNRK